VGKRVAESARDAGAERASQLEADLRAAADEKGKVDAALADANAARQAREREVGAGRMVFGKSAQ